MSKTVPAFLVPACSVGCAGLRCTPTDVVTLAALRALAAHTSDCFDEGSQRWFGVRLREIAGLLSPATKAGAHRRIRRLEERGPVCLRRVNQKIYVAFQPEAEEVLKAE